MIKEVQAYFLVSFDKDFKKFKEYKTPKIFIEDIGLIPNLYLMRKNFKKL